MILAALLGLKQPDKPRIIPAVTPPEASVEVLDPFDVVWGELAKEARQIQWCESRNDPNATNGIHIGLFQINYKIWGKEYGVTREQLFIPEINWQIARNIYSRTNSWGAWSCKKVLRY